MTSPRRSTSLAPADSTMVLAFDRNRFNTHEASQITKPSRANVVRGRPGSNTAGVRRRPPGRLGALPRHHPDDVTGPAGHQVIKRSRFECGDREKRERVERPPRTHAKSCSMTADVNAAIFSALRDDLRGPRPSIFPLQTPRSSARSRARRFGWYKVIDNPVRTSAEVRISGRSRSGHHSMAGRCRSWRCLTSPTSRSSCSMSIYRPRATSASSTTRMNSPSGVRTRRSSGMEGPLRRFRLGRRRRSARRRSGVSPALVGRRTGTSRFQGGRNQS